MSASAATVEHSHTASAAWNEKSIILFPCIAFLPSRCALKNTVVFDNAVAMLVIVPVFSGASLSGERQPCSFPAFHLQKKVCFLVAANTAHQAVGKSYGGKIQFFLMFETNYFAACEFSQQNY